MRTQAISIEKPVVSGSLRKLEQARKTLHESGLLKLLEEGQQRGETAGGTIERIAAENASKSNGYRQNQEECSEKMQSAKGLLKRTGITAEVLDEAEQMGEPAAAVFQRMASKNSEKSKKATTTKPLESDWMLNAVIDEWLESSARLAEKDAEIKALRDQIARLEARIAELEKPAAVA